MTVGALLRRASSGNLAFIERQAAEREAMFASARAGSYSYARRVLSTFLPDDRAAIEAAMARNEMIGHLLTAATVNLARSQP